MFVWASCLVGHLAAHLGILFVWASGHLVSKFLKNLKQENFENTFLKFFENFEILKKSNFSNFFKKIFQNFVIFKMLLAPFFPHV